MKRKLAVHNSRKELAKIQQENMRLVERLQNQKPAVIIEKPRQYTHLSKNLKKRQILECKAHFDF